MDKFERQAFALLAGAWLFGAALMITVTGLIVYGVIRAAEAIAGAL